LHAIWIEIGTRVHGFLASTTPAREKRERSSDGVGVPQKGGTKWSPNIIRRRRWRFTQDSILLLITIVRPRRSFG